MAQIDAFFKLMNEQGASDLHMMAGMPPILRIRGEMEPVKYKVMGNEALKAMLYEICPEEKIKVFEENFHNCPKVWLL
jgi:twitching motility protein PilT